ncbi:RelA/SpoT family protein [Arenimonas terrae]|jgi:guanosine-3',5'-bis(diphosphate) 3'-pyrophosphohydrolase|uniref:guanosine-3',5'-bis(diphosphate) 3'-diphosphatase n=1 Tax=Arenimonas terrae TaxID=2546226 RepID=A0A5C4RR72_9GAMM|nr:bifunctional (p)ppGpp synthetase/guanosine-3',5'-bis(diphosphate) 3'-pyrophosphohydrolase [Arenimonas terrae]TNJ33793.1 bifunctional (p)ppGpp synthetase/guanosine-3',5'-bis(diphosphate) 3'-pyrophosphohydrolase [Arenimonas terrae]
MSSFTKPQLADVGPDPCPEAVSALERRLADYLPPDQVKQVRRAYEMGARAHEGQTRRSGEAYITHPVAVAGILAELRLDAETLCAAILHDALEDTPLPRADIEKQFSPAVAELVDGVTKLDKLQFRDRQEAAAESFRKMMLAMARDLRVILIKLADRLHNMRTLDAMAAESRRRIARETLEIYAPIAQRLGMNKIKAELQDLGFRALHPIRHQVISRRIASQPVMRREALTTIEAQLAQRLAQEGLRHTLVSRVKSPWSIYTKMRQENKSLEQVLDVFGFRIVVPTVMQCYHALGAVHSIYKPLDARFRDFIAIPKANGYQSLHTVLFGPYGAPVEVQIRTEDMDLVAERGIAAHWVYKSAGTGGSAAQARAQDWVRNLMDSQQAAGSSLEFLDNVKVDLFPDEVYLFTPKGDILALPRNATALDFAYAVHTDVGNHAVAARVDKKLVPLRTKLASGQSVEIITAPSATPGPQWLEFVVSSKARTAIRHFLKRLEHEDAVDLGHRMLDRALEGMESSLDRIPADTVEQLLADLRYRRLEELLADIALGNRMPAQVARLMLHGQEELPLAPLSASPTERIMITGSERGVLSFAQCCHPIPGDEIMGYLSAGKGVVVHRLDCPNVAEYRKFPERCVPMAWDRNVEGDYRVALRIEVENKPGVLAQVAAAVAESNSNIDAVEYRERDVAVSVMEFAIEVRNRKHLADVIRRIRRLGVVHGVQRL